jgi:hypothetical protein
MPTALGAQTGTLTINTTAANTPPTVALSGKGIHSKTAPRFAGNMRLQFGIGNLRRLSVRKLSIFRKLSCRHSSVVHAVWKQGLLWPEQRNIRRV